MLLQSRSRAFQSGAGNLLQSGAVATTKWVVITN